MVKIGFGGGCHWCTEAVFQSLKGIKNVEQGWIASVGENSSFSEAVIVHYDESEIDLESLVAIHLYTHSCTSDHTMRSKYRSAVYTFDEQQSLDTLNLINKLQSDFRKPIITQVLIFAAFKENKEQYQNYYTKHSENQFCKTYIRPKLKLLLRQFSKMVDKNKTHLEKTLG